MIKNILENSIKTALWSLKIDEKKVSKINLEHPEDLTHGDYSCNIAMVLAKQVAQNPRELAEKIVAEINERKPKEILKVEVAGPGFINFYLSDEFFISQSKEILNKKENFGLNKNLKGEKTVVEYTDPNPFKEFHIGHLMSNAIGESIARVIEANGAKVKRACYQGDVGLHVAKAIQGYMFLSDLINNHKKLDTIYHDEKDFVIDHIPNEKDDLIYKAKYLGTSYSIGSRQYEDGFAKDLIIEINKKIYDRSDKEINKIYDSGKKISLEYFESIYKILGTKFDEYFFESKTGP
ncbi:MAG: arginine--tRNA ligase, partial [Candidatus Paceibacterota bacterium]